MNTTGSLTSKRRPQWAEVFLRSPGPWLFIGGIEAMLLIHLAEFLYPRYSVSENYISDLGVGPLGSSVLFTVAVISFGLMSIIAAALFRQKNKKLMIWKLMVLSGIGAIGVGAVNVDHPFSIIHRASALLAFLFGNLAAVYSYRLARPPISHAFALLGLVGLSALGLFGAEIYLGLGIGGMERMILYPAMFWAILFGGYLSAEETRANQAR